MKTDDTNDPVKLFAQEMDFFEVHRQEWVNLYPRKFAVLKGAAVHGFYDTSMAAYESGVRQFGENTPFMIKEVLPEDIVLHIPALTCGLMYAHH